MICCTDCFFDVEVKAAIESLGHKGDCPICHSKHTWIYDSEKDFENSSFEELLSSIIEIYKAEEELSINVVEEARLPIEEHLVKDWNIFNVDLLGVRTIVEDIVLKSMTLDKRLLSENCAINEMYDEGYLFYNSIMGKYSWENFKLYLRNENRFHSRYIQLEVLEEVLKDTETVLPKGMTFYRARLAKNKDGFKRKELGAPPKDLATAGRANSKGVSCLYLADKRETTVKEIRAGAFDFVTIGKFRLNRDLKVLDLSSITHNSPFYADTDKVKYLINETHLKNIAEDLSKPMNSNDSDLDYLPTQYISAFAKYLGYDGVKYMSTFDSTSYNIALFDVEACDCIYHKTYHIGDLQYKLNAL
ncbi:MAG: RES family NAD+ phosphorylase [Lachnospiraceae bacterium]|nr:RES family NAD+ phosphorylase [Lachnospiraceae bacterium]